MMSAQGKWCVEVQNFSTMIVDSHEQPIKPVINSDHFDSLETALEFACGKRRILHHKVTVKGPDGTAMSDDELAQRCAALTAKT